MFGCCCQQAGLPFQVLAEDTSASMSASITCRPKLFSRVIKRFVLVTYPHTRVFQHPSLQAEFMASAGCQQPPNGCDATCRTPVLVDVACCMELLWLCEWESLVQ